MEQKLTAEEYLESIGFEFDKDEYGFWLEDNWCANYNEHKVKDIFEFMKSYAEQIRSEEQAKTRGTAVEFAVDMI